MEQKLQSTIHAMGTVLDPKKGQGWVEAFFALLIMCLVAAAMFLPVQEIPRWLVAALGVLTGYYFKDKEEQYREQ